MLPGLLLGRLDDCLRFGNRGELDLPTWKLILRLAQRKVLGHNLYSQAGVHSSAILKAKTNIRNIDLGPGIISSFR